VGLIYNGGLRAVRLSKCSGRSSHHKIRKKLKVVSPT
jgi:hypothetical protein